MTFACDVEHTSSFCTGNRFSLMFLMIRNDIKFGIIILISFAEINRKKLLSEVFGSVTSQVFQFSELRKP